jgi:hypothetical protein
MEILASQTNNMKTLVSFAYPYLSNQNKNPSIERNAKTPYLIELGYDQVDFVSTKAAKHGNINSITKQDQHKWFNNPKQ